MTREVCENDADTHGGTSDHIRVCGSATTTAAQEESGLCDASGVTVDAMTREVCANDATTCETYMKKQGSIQTCSQYCDSFGMSCPAQYEDNNGCTRQHEGSCDDTHGGTSDHICVCGSATTTRRRSTPPEESGLCDASGVT